jgi:CRP-like cAMP-binding protein
MTEQPELADYWPAGKVALVDLHPDLATGLTAVELAGARNGLQVPVVRVPAGRCDLGLCARAAETRGPLLGAVIIEGLLICETWLAGQVSAQIHGPGDLLNADREQDGSLATAHTLLATGEVDLAMLDDCFLAALRRWPQLAARFFTQAMRQADRAGEHKAISQLPRVEDRLVALFWHLADRCGRVGPDGVLIDLRLTHETIGRLIGARRSTVTLGLTALAGTGLLQRTSDGKWLLDTATQPRNGVHPSD